MYPFESLKVNERQGFNDPAPPAGMNDAGIAAIRLDCRQKPKEFQ